MELVGFAPGALDVTRDGHAHVLAQPVPEAGALCLLNLAALVRGAPLGLLRRGQDRQTSQATPDAASARPRKERTMTATQAAEVCERLCDACLALEAGCGCRCASCDGSKLEIEASRPS